MAFQIICTKRAKKDLDELKGDKSKKRILKAVIKSIKFLAQSPKHPSLKTHQYHSIAPVYPRQKVWEVYAQDKTPAALGFLGVMALRKIKLQLFQLHRILNVKTLRK